MKQPGFVALRALIRCPVAVVRFAVLLLALFGLSGCGEISKARREVGRAGPEKLRQEVLAACREGFASGGVQQIQKTNWPATARAIHPLGVWAEPDGAYLLIDSDADGERGVYLPRILSEKDPLCSPTLKHEKLALGVYWYDRKR